MKKIIGYAVVAITAVIVLYKLVDSAQHSPEKVLDIATHWTFAWLKVMGIMAVATAIIFLINKRIKEEETMSRVGTCIMPVLLPVLLYLCFSFTWWLMAFGVVVGYILGRFSYVIDDRLLDAWKQRRIFLPLVFGLCLGGSTIVAALAENWQNEIIYVQDFATCHSVTLSRYTKHTTYHKKGSTSYYSYDAYKTVYSFQPGESFGELLEGRDYSLSYGDNGVQDRVSHDYYKWIGGERLNKAGERLGFKWVYLSSIDFKFTRNAVYEVEENFFGQAIQEGKQCDLLPPQLIATEHVIPTVDDVPEMMGMTFSFFKIMFTNDDFALLRWIYLAIYCIIGAGAPFWADWRLALILFFVSSTIIIIVVIVAIAARSGRTIDDLMPDFTGGGGDFGGAGASERW